MTPPIHPSDPSCPCPLSQPIHQKLILKVKGKLDDVQSLRSLQLRNGDKLMIIGSEEKDIPQDSVAEDVVDDLEGDLSYDRADQSVLDVPEHRLKLEKYKGLIDINFISPPRQGKKLLVLDLDATLFDMTGQNDDFTQLQRPFTHRQTHHTTHTHTLPVIWPAPF